MYTNHIDNTNNKQQQSLHATSVWLQASRRGCQSRNRDSVRMYVHAAGDTWRLPFTSVYHYLSRSTRRVTTFLAIAIMSPWGRKYTRPKTFNVSESTKNNAYRVCYLPGRAGANGTIKTIRTTTDRTLSSRERPLRSLQLIDALTRVSAK